MILHVLEWQFKNIDGGLYIAAVLKILFKVVMQKRKKKEGVCNSECILSLFLILATNFLTE